MKSALFYAVSFLILLPSSFALEITGNVQEIKEQQTLHYQGDVFLQIHEQDKQIASKKASTDAQGRFQIQLQDAKSPWYYRIKVPYEGLDFYSDFFTSETTTIPPLTVSKATSDPANIYISEIIFFEFSKKADLAKITHQILLENKGDLTYHPKKDPSSAVALPLVKGGFNLSLVENIERSEIQVNEEKHTLFALKTLNPGQKESFRFTYSYPLQDRSIEFHRNSNLQQHDLHLIFNIKGIKKPFKDASAMDIPSELQSTFKKAYQIQTPAPDMTLVITGYWRQRDIPILYAFIASFLVMVLFFFLYGKTKPVRTHETKDDLINQIKSLQSSDLEAASKEKQINSLKIKLFYLKNKPW